MNDQIVTIEHIQEKARNAFARGVKRHDHGMNPWAPALKTWLAEWDRCAQFAVDVDDVRSAQP